MKRILLDENLPRRLAALVSQTATTVAQRGWSGTKNGSLIRLAAAEFDVILTMDRGIEFEQNLAEIDLCIIGLRACSNRLDDLLPLLDDVKAAIEQCSPGTYVQIGNFGNV